MIYKKIHIIDISGKMKKKTGSTQMLAGAYILMLNAMFILPVFIVHLIIPLSKIL